MLPIGILMQEHRVIEKMMPALREAAAAGRRDGTVEPRFLDLALDILRTYADRCHHGKEEDILFRALEGKPLDPALRATMNDLIAEHRLGRRAVRELGQAAEAYGRGDRSVLPAILDRLDFLSRFYPAHILKEDKGFFLPAMDVLSDAEKAEMIAVEREFDRALVHALYRDRVAEAVRLGR